MQQNEHNEKLVNAAYLKTLKFNYASILRVHNFGCRKSIVFTIGFFVLLDMIAAIITLITNTYESIGNLFYFAQILLLPYKGLR